MKIGSLPRIAAGPLAALAVGLAPIPGLDGAAQSAAAIATWMAVWWVGEAVPLSVTSLLPLAAYPALGILDARATSAAYANETIFLFLGGMLLAQSMERHGLHRRIALRVLGLFGGSGHRLVLGFMVATALISLWVSNTATVVMLLPVVLATLHVVAPVGAAERNAASGSPAAAVATARDGFARALLLGVGYAATLGGLGTPVGTAPNLVFLGVASRLFPDLRPITFFDWMKVGVPLVAIFVPLAWIAIVFVSSRFDERALGLDRSHLDRERRALGSLSRPEAWTLAIFSSAALLWVFRADIDLGVATIPGWSRLFGQPRFLADSTVAMAAALLLFLIPSGRAPGDRLVAPDWYTRIPWDVLLLLGGGFALAESFQATGLSEWFGARLGGLHALPLPLLIPLLCAGVTLFSEIASNTATATVLLPILGAMASAIGVHPFLLMLPCTFAASCGFMLPVATPPNALVFSVGRLATRDMVRAGILVDLVGVALISLFALTYIPWVLGIPLP